MYICSMVFKISQALPLIRGLDVFLPTHYLILSLLVLALSPYLLFSAMLNRKQRNLIQIQTQN